MNEPTPFDFADLFAGIGGFRRGLEESGGRCLVSAEWDPHARATYEANYGHEPQVGDVRSWVDDIEGGEAPVPSVHLLAGGFPCQPFSIAGVSKKNSLGRSHGFLDATQGTLFFEIARLVNMARPPILMLENVKNLLHHDGGRTFATISDTLYELGYSVSSEIIDAAHWVPQHRERIFIVALRRDLFGTDLFRFPDAKTLPPRAMHLVGDVIRPEDLDPHEQIAKYVMTERLWEYLQEYKERHRMRGNGFGFGQPDLTNAHSVTRTLSARYYKDGSEIVVTMNSGRPRRLTPKECALLMGFGAAFTSPVSDQQAYRQFGNAVVPPVVDWLTAELQRQGIIAAAVSGDGSLAAQRRAPTEQLSLASAAGGTV